MTSREREDLTTAATARMFMEQRDAALAELAEMQEGFALYVETSRRKARAFGDRCRAAEAERDALRVGALRLLRAYEAEETEHGFPFNFELRSAHQALKAHLDEAR